MYTSEEKRYKVAAATALFIAALVIVARAVHVETSPSPSVSSCVASPSASVVNAGAKIPRESKALDPTIHLSRLVFSENQGYEGSGRNIFSALVPRRPEKIAEGKKIVPPGPAETVAASPLSLRFFGYAITPSHPRKVFLLDKDALFIAREGEIVDRRYRIAKVQANSIDVDDLIEHRPLRLMLSGTAGLR